MRKTIGLVVACLCLTAAMADDVVTVVAPKEQRRDPNVITTSVFDERPTDERLREALTDGGARYPMTMTKERLEALWKDSLDKSACDDAMQCAAAAKDTCRAIGQKVKKQVFDIAQNEGCRWTCSDGTEGVAACVQG